MDEKISKLFLPLLDKLYNTEPAGEPFRQPVDVVKYGCFDYYLYVKHPIDLSTIRRRLTNLEYKDAWRFVADIELMFANAYLFNKKGTPVYDFTNKLNRIWNAELTPILQRLNYCCGTLHKFGPQLLYCHGTTPDRYCQIAIGAKYKCYQDQYSFCLPCFNKIEPDYIDIKGLACENPRMKLPTQPVKKSDFVDCANDHWQYESFIRCTRCTRRVHQICDCYPAEESEIEGCIQHAQLEHEQKMLCQVPEEYRVPASDETNQESAQKINEETTCTSLYSKKQDSPKDLISEFDDVEILEETTQPIPKQFDNLDRPKSKKLSNEALIMTANRTSTHAETSLAIPSEQHQELTATSLDDELLQFARDVDDFTQSAPASPCLEDTKNRSECAKNNQSTVNSKINSKEQPSPHVSTQNAHNFSNNNNSGNLKGSVSGPSIKNSVDNIAARLSINKLTAEPNVQELRKSNGIYIQSRDKFVCNHCYRIEKLGINYRHRKYSARRLPHTRMSKYIETKVNEHIRENSPMAGEITIRVLTAYRDTVSVKPEMREYVKRCRQKNQDPFNQHPNLKDYPNEFGYTNRAIFAWQEIDGVDVCVFGMHLQEYGEDCPEPNKQVVYLSYLDSVHFLRPRQIRTAVYHEILLSYFKYVKKLGFRRVFIWVCPSRKGDDYIFYRHPTEQKMPTLKRLSDWYVNLLDKGIMAGIVERHHNIYQYAGTQNWSSILSMPYLSGDYWPGEFERLLNIMIESQKEYEEKLRMHQQQTIKKEPIFGNVVDHILQDDQNRSNFLTNSVSDPILESSLISIKDSNLSQQTNTLAKYIKQRTSLLNPRTPNSLLSNSICFGIDGDLPSLSQGNDDTKHSGAYSPESSRSDYDQPLDLSKGSSNTSPESYIDDDRISELSCTLTNSKKKRRKSSNAMGYTKKRSRTTNNSTRANRPNEHSLSGDVSSRLNSQAAKSSRQKSSTQSRQDSQGSEVILNPEEELIKNLERSLKRQKEGFIVARLNECDCSPNFELQRRKEEATFVCDLMKGREPFLQLARLKNYEFSTLRRAKFSSLAMVKHLSQYFKLDPICNECFSFDTSKRHFSCQKCYDYYLCTSCYENTLHEHPMTLMSPSTLPDIDDFMQSCSMASGANSVSSVSSTTSNRSYSDSTVELPQSVSPTSGQNESPNCSTPLGRRLSRNVASRVAANSSSMPLSCQKQKNNDSNHQLITRADDEENTRVNPFDQRSKLPLNQSPPPSHSSGGYDGFHLELDRVLVDNFVRHAEVTYDVDFDQMKNESKKLLSHYLACSSRETCHQCKFVVLSCSFMSVLMRNTTLQMMIGNCGPGDLAPNTAHRNSVANSANHPGGINLTAAHQLSYQSKDK